MHIISAASLYCWSHETCPWVLLPLLQMKTHLSEKLNRADKSVEIFFPNTFHISHSYAWLWRLRKKGKFWNWPLQKVGALEVCNKEKPRQVWMSCIAELCNVLWGHKKRRCSYNRRMVGIGCIRLIHTLIAQPKSSLLSPRYRKVE